MFLLLSPTESSSNFLIQKKTTTQPSFGGDWYVMDVPALIRTAKKKKKKMRATAQVTQTQSTNDCAGCPTATPTWSSIYRYLQWIRVMSVTGKVPTGQRHVSQKTTECNYARRKNIPEMIGLSKEPCFSGIFEPDGRCGFSKMPRNSHALIKLPSGNLT